MTQRTDSRDDALVLLWQNHIRPPNNGPGSRPWKEYEKQLAEIWKGVGGSRYAINAAIKRLKKEGRLDSSRGLVIDGGVWS